MARRGVISEDERDEAVVIDSPARDANGLMQIGDRDSEMAWDEWISGLRESEGTGTITAFKLPVDAEGNPTQGRGSRQIRLGAWPHMLYSFDELSDKIIKGFLKPGEVAHVRFVGTQPQSRGVVCQKIVTLTRSSDDTQERSEFASAMKVTQDALAQQAQMIERLVTRDAPPIAPPRDMMQTVGQLATILAPILTPLITHLVTRQPPKSDLANLMETMLKMKEFIGGSGEGSSDNDSAVSIVKAVAPGAMQLLATLAAQRQTTAPPRRMIARPAPGTVPTRIPAPVAAPAPIPQPTSAQLLESDPMLAQLQPQLETLAQIAETNADPVEVAKLVLDSVPETFDEKLWELISEPTRFNRLFLLAPKLNAHKEWMEKLRVALVAEYTDDMPQETATVETQP